MPIIDGGKEDASELADAVLVEPGPDRVLVNVPVEESTTPAPKTPPAAEESWANPMDGGDEARNTVYTFLRKVAPTTQEGLGPPAGILLPRLKSKIAPTQGPLRVSCPRFISIGSIAHDLPPKAIVAEILLVQGNV